MFCSYQGMISHLIVFFFFFLLGCVSFILIDLLCKRKEWPINDRVFFTCFCLSFSAWQGNKTDMVISGYDDHFLVSLRIPYIWWACVCVWTKLWCFTKCLTGDCYPNRKHGHNTACQVWRIHDVTAFKNCQLKHIIMAIHCKATRFCFISVPQGQLFFFYLIPACLWNKVTTSFKFIELTALFLWCN